MLLESLGPCNTPPGKTSRGPRPAPSDPAVVLASRPDRIVDLHNHASSSYHVGGRVSTRRGSTRGSCSTYRS